MDRAEAKSLLIAKVEEYRQLPYEQIKARINTQECVEITGPSETWYQVEICFYWDDRKRGHIRVAGAIDDGGWRAFAPLSGVDFIIAPDGSYIDEER